MNIASQSGNTLSVYDSRAGAGGAVNATISGSVVTYSGDRFPVPGSGCADMSVNYSVTLNGAGTNYSGSGTIICLDAPACTVPISISGTKRP